MYEINFPKFRYKINKGYNVPNQILDNKILLKNHNMLFSGMNIYTLEEKSNIIGRCIHEMLKNGINDEVVNVAKYFIERLRNCKSINNDKIGLINIIYSTLIKKVTLSNILSGNISPEVYRDMINESIDNYVKNPINGNIDYRHIVGRMVTLKNTYKGITTFFGKLPLKFNPLKWTDDMQLDYLAVMEKISRNYEESSKNFSIVKSFRYNYVGRNNYTQYEHNKRYRENIIELFKLTLSKVTHLMQNPLKNKDIIEDKLDIAYTYFDKISYTDPDFSSFSDLIQQLKQQDKLLSKHLKAKHRSQYKNN